MKLKPTLLFLLLVCHGIVAKAQNILHINLSVQGKHTYIHSIDVRTGKLLLRLSTEGEIVIDALHPNAHYEYWGSIDGRFRQGKLKAINRIPIDYYDQFDMDGNTGKLRSVGSLPVTYYDRFDMDDNQGKIKSIGDITFTYYDRFDMNNNQGKLKSVGQSTITYYDRFASSHDSGYIKSISSDNPLLRVINSTDDLY